MLTFVSLIIARAKREELFMETFSNYHFAIFSLKKHFIIYPLNNKNYLYKKIIGRKKQVQKHELI